MTQDTERFGTVTATLADETIRIGASVSQGAAFQFGLRAAAFLPATEVASPNIASPPEIFVNAKAWERFRWRSRTWRNLPIVGRPLPRPRNAFPIYRLASAQKLVPAMWRAGTNDILIKGR